MQTVQFPFAESVKFAWQKTKENFWNLIAVTVIVMVVNGVFNSLEKHTAGVLPLVSMIIWICSWLVSLLMALGVIKIALKVYAGERFEISDIFTNTKKFLDYLLASILYFVAVVFGLVLLIVPGIIIAIRMGFYSYLIVDKEMGPVDALKESMNLTKGSSWNIFFFWFLLLGIVLLGFLALIVGIVVAIPVTWIAYVFVYKFLEEKQTTGVA